VTCCITLQPHCKSVRFPDFLCRLSYAIHPMVSGAVANVSLRLMAPAPIPELRMPHWVVLCPKCRSIFPHSEIGPRSESLPYDPLWPVKPEVPLDGVKLTCPNCQTASMFKRFELMYRPA
jgi:hypothetical protein